MATTSDTGKKIAAVSATLAVVPVVGWIGAAAGAVVGGIVAVVGSKWNQSADVRWLIQLYQFYVLGQSNVTSDNLTNEAYAQTAQAYFSLITGVPIGGRNDLNILQSGDGNTNTIKGVPTATRAKNYLAYKQLTGVISQQQAEDAANIASLLSFNAIAGSWAGLKVAPSVVDTSGKVYAGSVATNPAGIGTTDTSITEIIFIVVAVIIIVLLLIFYKGKK